MADTEGVPTTLDRRSDRGRHGGVETGAADPARRRCRHGRGSGGESLSSSPPSNSNGCTLEVTRVDLGDTGPSVECVQKALTAAGFYNGAISGTFDEATDTAARTFQSTQDLEVDGIVGGRTATTLGIWPGDESFVVRTPPPAAGAMDSWGYTLSSVATTGADAPPMPENSGQGTGKRVVYDRAGQRVWAIDDEERVVRSLPRHREPVQQRDAGRPQGVQQVRGVDGVERPGATCR